MPEIEGSEALAWRGSSTEWVDMVEGWKENLCYCGEV